MAGYEERVAPDARITLFGNTLEELEAKGALPDDLDRARRWIEAYKRGRTFKTDRAFMDDFDGTIARLANLALKVPAHAPRYSIADETHTHTDAAHQCVEADLDRADIGFRCRVCERLWI